MLGAAGAAGDKVSGAAEGAGRPLGLTLGDPCGIGPELWVRILCEERTRPGWAELPPLMLFGDVELLERTARTLGRGAEWQATSRELRLVEVTRLAATDAEPGRPLCCGRTWLSLGQVEAARREALRMQAALRPALAAGTPIVGLEPSCILSLRDDHLKLGLGPEAETLAKQVYLFEEFIARENDRKHLKLALKPLPAGKTLVHGHCHQKAVGAMKSLRKVLRLIPEFDFEFIEASCCGMSGSFGLDAEHRDISLQMAELDLLPALRQAPDAALLANGFSCRHQIREGSGREPVHVAVLLRQALANPA